MYLKKTVLATLLTLGICSHAYALDFLELYKEAYANDPTVQQAKADRDYYAAAIDEATSKLLPQIDLFGSWYATRTSTNRFSGSNNNNRALSGGISLSQKLWQHSSWISRSIAEKTFIRYDLIYQDALQNLIIRVARAYFGVLSAADTLNYNKANNAAVKRQLDEANRQFQVGVIAETDRLEAQSAYDLSNAKVIAAENALANSYESIRALTGHGVKIEDMTQLDLDKFDTPEVEKTLQALIKVAEGNNLSLQAKVIARDVAKDNIDLALTGHEPTLTLNGKATTNYYRYDNETTSSANGNSWSHTIGLDLNIPLYHGGATVAQTEEAEAKYVRACQELEAEHRTLITNTTNYYNNVNASISSVRAYNQSVKSAKTALDATIAGYDVGTRTMTDVLDATQNLYSALQNAAASRYDYIKSRLSLEYYEGTLSSEHVEQVNNILNKNAKPDPYLTAPRSSRSNP